MEPGSVAQRRQVGGFMSFIHHVKYGNVFYLLHLIHETFKAREILHLACPTKPSGGKACGSALSNAPQNEGLHAAKNDTRRANLPPFFALKAIVLKAMSAVRSPAENWQIFVQARSLSTCRCPPFNLLILQSSVHQGSAM
jgi:hypothetical protein